MYMKRWPKVSQQARRRVEQELLRLKPEQLRQSARIVLQTVDRTLCRTPNQDHLVRHMKNKPDASP
jgi:hypothetical protein